MREVIHEYDFLAHADVFGLDASSKISERPNMKIGYMNIGVCAIYDGQNYYFGLSSTFEYPPAIQERKYKTINHYGFVSHGYFLHQKIIHI